MADQDGADTPKARPESIDIAELVEMAGEIAEEAIHQAERRTSLRSLLAKMPQGVQDQIREEGRRLGFGL